MAFERVKIEGGGGVCGPDLNLTTSILVDKPKVLCWTLSGEWGTPSMYCGIINSSN